MSGVDPVQAVAMDAAWWPNIAIKSLELPGCDPFSPAYSRKQVSGCHIARLIPSKGGSRPLHGLGNAGATTTGGTER